MIASIGPNLPHDVLVATGRFAGPLAVDTRRSTERASQWLESKFAPWTKMVVEAWADGERYRGPAARAARRKLFVPFAVGSMLAMTRWSKQSGRRTNAAAPCRRRRKGGAASWRARLPPMTAFTGLLKDADSCRLQRRWLTNGAMWARS